MAYRAEIEIGVKGVRQLEQLRSEINKSASAAETLNKVVGERGGLVQNIQNYINNLNRAATTLNLVTAGTKEETKAIQEYVTAEEKANAILQRKINLLDQERNKREEIRRVRKLTAAGIFETTRFAEPIGPGAASPVTLASQLRGRTDQILKLEKASVEASNATFEAALRHEQTLNRLELDNDSRVFQNKLKQLDLLGDKELAVIKQNDAAALTDFDRRLNKRLSSKATVGATGGGRVGGIISNAVIGGAFPLLFGQGGGAATGGAIGGAVGGLFGGAGGFAGSLLGTLLGQIAGQANQVKELAADIGFSAQQTRLLANAFKQAGQDFDKFQESVSRIQGLGLALEQQAAAIQLASTLTESYGGKIDKVTNAFTTALQTGKVTQATLNQLTSQGIPIQEALANKYDVSRSALLLMAKDGKISVQDLLDVLVNLGNESQKAANSTEKTFGKTFDNITQKVSELSPKVSTAFTQLQSVAVTSLNNILQSLEPLIIALANTAVKTLELGAAFVSAFAGIPNYVQNVTNAVISLIPGLNIIAGVLRFMKTVDTQPQRQGPAVPERLQRPAIPRIIAPSQLAASGAGGKRGRTGADDAAREAQRVAEVVRSRLAEAEIIKVKSGLQDRIAAAEADSDKLLVIRLQGQQREIDLQYRYAQDLAKEKDLRAQQAIIYAGQVALTANLRETERQLNEEYNNSARQRISAMEQLIGKQYELNAQQERQRDTAESLAITFGQGMTSAFSSLVQGSQDFNTSLREIASGVLIDIANQLLQIFVIQKAINAISNLFGGGGTAPLSYAGVSGNVLGTSMISGGFTAVPFSTAGLGFGGGFGIMGRATGGPVANRTPYIVGERGPELFVPNSSGTIIPNNQLGGMGGDISVVVNVDASGSNVQGNESQAKALGGAISAAVQAEIVKQQRPGGLLAGTR